MELIVKNSTTNAHKVMSLSQKIRDSIQRFDNESNGGAEILYRQGCRRTRSPRKYSPCERSCSNIRLENCGKECGEPEDECSYDSTGCRDQCESARNSRISINITRRSLNNCYNRTKSPQYRSPSPCCHNPYRAPIKIKCGTSRYRPNRNTKNCCTEPCNTNCNDIAFETTPVECIKLPKACDSLKLSPRRCSRAKSRTSPCRCDRSCSRSACPVDSTLCMAKTIIGKTRYTPPSSKKKKSYRCCTCGLINCKCPPKAISSPRCNCNKCISNYACKPKCDDTYVCKPKCDDTYVCKPKCDDTYVCKPKCDDTYICKSKCDDTYACKPTCDDTYVCKPKCNDTYSCKPKCNDTYVCRSKCDDTYVCKPKCDDTILVRPKCDDSYARKTTWEDSYLCKPKCDDTYICKPKCDDTYKCKPKCDDTYLCKPKCDDTYICRPKCDDTYVCKTKCDDTYLCKPKCDDTYLCKPKCDDTYLCKSKCDDKYVCKPKCDDTYECKPKCDDSYECKPRCDDAYVCRPKRTMSPAKRDPCCNKYTLRVDPCRRSDPCERNFPCRRTRFLSPSRYGRYRNLDSNNCKIDDDCITPKYSNEYYCKSKCETYKYPCFYYDPCCNEIYVKLLDPCAQPPSELTELCKPIKSLLCSESGTYFCISPYLKLQSNCTKPKPLSCRNDDNCGDYEVRINNLKSMCNVRSIIFNKNCDCGESRGCEKCNPKDVQLVCCPPKTDPCCPKTRRLSLKKNCKPVKCYSCNTKNVRPPWNDNCRICFDDICRKKPNPSCFQCKCSGCTMFGPSYCVQRANCRVPCLCAKYPCLPKFFRC